MKLNVVVTIAAVVEADRLPTYDEIGQAREDLMSEAGFALSNLGAFAELEPDAVKIEVTA